MNFKAITVSMLSLFVSAIMSSPLFMMTELKVYTNLLSDGVTSFCYEAGKMFKTLVKLTVEEFQNWTNINHHFTYTIICFLVQYLIPSIIIGYIYCKVCKALPNIRTNAPKTNMRMIRKMARRKRANIILVGVSLIFFICWAPINILNIFMNISTMFKVRTCSNDPRLFSFLAVPLPSRPASASDYILWLPPFCHDFCHIQPCALWTDQ